MGSNFSIGGWYSPVVFAELFLPVAATLLPVLLAPLPAVPLGFAAGFLLLVEGFFATVEAVVVFGVCFFLPSAVDSATF